MIQLNSATLITYGLLTLALLGLWLPRTPYFSLYAPWAVFLVIAIIAGLFFNILQPIALLWIVLLGGSTWALTQKDLGLAIKSAMGWAEARSSSIAATIDGPHDVWPILCAYVLREDKTIFHNGMAS